jgi:hypothetical protein
MIVVLRSIAIAIALVAAVDPSIVVRRALPVPVDIRALPSAADPAGTAARKVGERLVARLGNAVEINELQPAAIVVIGGAPDGATLPEGVPISTISLAPSGRNVRVVEVRTPGVAIRGQVITIVAEVEAVAAAGAASVVALQQGGLELSRVEHVWRHARERFSARFVYVVSQPGLTPLRVMVQPLAGEATEADNEADVAVRAAARPLRVLAWEPRPGWSVAFVRRALEADPAFEVSSLARSSRGLDTRAGAPPSALSPGALALFDAVIVGAPENLTPRDVSALDAYVRERGGAALFLPDRPPSGAYMTMVPGERFEEVLLEKPAVVRTEGGALQASELALPVRTSRGAATLASVTTTGGERPAIVSWPRGEGIVVYSGALDAWRFRAANGEAFGSFWTGFIASLALASPPALAVDVTPASAAPGERISVRARYRTGEIVRDKGQTSVPAVRASLIAADGGATPLRLWPSAAPGEYEAVLDAPAAGRYDIRVSGPGGMTADRSLLVAGRTPRLSDVPAFISAATGGIAAHATDTSGVEDHLRGLSRPTARVPARPMRSAWWLVPLAGALCAEWGLRRSKGLR